MILLVFVCLSQINTTTWSKDYILYSLALKNLFNLQPIRTFNNTPSKFQKENSSISTIFGKLFVRSLLTNFKTHQTL